MMQKIVKNLLLNDGKIKPLRPAKLDFFHIRKFLEGYFKFYYYKYFAMRGKPTHIKEQVLYRMTLSKKCFENGACLICGCPTTEAFYIVKASCEGNCYPEMMTKLQWKKFKLEHGIH